MEQKRNLCTLFDKGYLLKGMALCASLQKFLSDFTLWILCMDEEAFDMLAALNLKNVRLISLGDFENENPELKEIKKTRSRAEYCWTLSPSLPRHILKKTGAASITYLDSDLFFFASPEVIFKEAEGKSIAIIAQNISASRKGTENLTGKYNVGMLIFQNDENGRACLDWWKEKCDEWCYDKPEPERYGDQKYLDYFEDKFKNVCILENKGACVAPWNIDGKNVGGTEENIAIDKSRLNFFHFSRFSLYPPSAILPYGPDTPYNYTKSSAAKDLIYRPYAKALYSALKKVRRIDSSWKFGVSDRPGFSASAEEFWNNSFKYPARRKIKALAKSLRIIR